MVERTRGQVANVDGHVQQTVNCSAAGAGSRVQQGSYASAVLRCPQLVRVSIWQQHLEHLKFLRHLAATERVEFTWLPSYQLQGILWHASAKMLPVL